MKLIAAGIDKKQDFALSTMLALRTLYALRQNAGETLESYYRRFQAAINTAEMMEAAVADHPGLIKSETPSGTRTTEKIKKACSEKYKAVLFLMSADYKSYSRLWARLSESVTLGRNEYPASMAAAFEILAKCRPKDQQPQAPTNNDDTRI